MMKTKLMAILLLMAGTVMAQQSDTTRVTDCERFMNRAGAIVEKKMITTGTIPVKLGVSREEMDVNALFLKDVVTGETRQCMVIEVLNKNKYTFIERDELDGLLKTLDLMIEKYLTTVPTSFIELAYGTRGGTEFGCFYDDDKWVIFIRLRKSENGSAIEMQPLGLEQFKGFVGRVKELINRSEKQ